MTSQGARPSLRHATSVVLAACVLSLMACAPQPPLGFPVRSLAREIRYCEEFRGYLALEGPKAFAVAGQPCGTYVAGLAFTDSEGLGGAHRARLDQPAAERLALQRCEDRRADHKVVAPCKLHARGDAPTEESELHYCGSFPDECSASPAPDLQSAR